MDQESGRPVGAPEFASRAAREGIHQQVIDILVDLFGADPGSLTYESGQGTVSGWDSLQHVNLVLELEHRFLVHLQPDEIARMTSVGSIVEVLGQKQRVC